MTRDTRRVVAVCDVDDVLVTLSAMCKQSNK